MFNMQSPKIGLNCLLPLVVSILLMLCVAQGRARDAKEAQPLYDVMGDDLGWTEIAAPRIADVLELLAIQFQGNFETIRTWQGKYTVELYELLSANYVAATFPDLPASTAQGLAKRSYFKLKFVIDASRDLIYRSKETTKSQFIGADGSTEIETSVQPVDEISIVSPEHYIHLSPRMVWANHSVLPDHPEAANKRSAIRDPVEEAEGQHFGDLVDPRDFFASNHHSLIYSDELNRILRPLRGDSDQEAVDLVMEILSVFQAEHDGHVLYCIKYVLRNPEPLLITYYWGPTAGGYYPVKVVISRNEKGAKPIQETKMEWKVIDEVAIPSVVIQTAYTVNGTMTYKREAVLQDCIVNEPLDPHQFDVRALGLANGELLVDKIENVMYVMKDGSLEKMADFGAKYVPPEESVSLVRPVMIILTVVLIVTLLVLIWHRRFADT